MKFGLQFREQYQKEAGGAIASELDNIVAFLQNLWDKIVDSDGDLKITLTDNSHGGDGTIPVYQSIPSVVEGINTTIAGLSSSFGGLGFSLVTRVLTDGEIKNLNSSAIQVVDPPGANRILVPLLSWLEADITTGFSSSPTNSIGWNAAPATGPFHLFAAITWTATGKKSTTVSLISAQQQNYGTHDPRNKALFLRATGNLNAGGAATGRISIAYITLDSTI